VRRTKEDAALTREKIFRAGISVFASKGYAAGTLGDVAREAGVSRGAIYWHFRNKEAFFQETVARLNRTYDDLIGNAMSTLKTGVEPAEAIELAVAEIIRRYARDREFRTMQELMMMTVFAHGDAPGYWERLLNRKDTEELSVLVDSMKEHKLYDAWTAQIALRSIEAVIIGVFVLIRDQKLDPSDEEIRQLAAFVRRGVAPVPEGAGL
jgi:AcrR family transcriptional regulator